jgi:hypothetical protein
MTFLPIVERELRVAARRRSTYWTRTGVAGGALLLFGGVVGILSLQRAGFGGQVGPILFGIFSWLAFMAVCAAGVLLTSDCVSEEKREGTLGLLFLTNLRGHDVVLGKLLANSLQAIYGLLAAFPIIGLGFLLGGVTGAEFGRLVVVLCNTLFFSLALGVYVSTVSRDAQRAMTGAILLLLGFLVGFPAVDSALTGWDSTNFVPRLSYFGPYHGFGLVRELRPVGLALNVCLVHASGWLLLALASFLAPRTWQEKASNLSGPASRGHRIRFGSPAKRVALRQRWLAENPVRWLAARELWLGRFMWVFWGAMVLLAARIGFGIHVREVAASVGSVLYYLVAFVFKLWLISQACRFFLEAARTGTLELLLVSPLGPERIVRGQAWALRRRFLLPAALLLVAHAVLTVIQIQITTKSMAGATAATAATPAGTTPFVLNDFFIMQIISGIGSLVTFVTGLFALGWFGMWMGLTSKKINPAMIKTLVFVDILPAMALTLVQGLLMFGMIFARMPMWVPGIIVVAAQVAVHLAFIGAARRRLLTRFRETVSRALGAPTFAKPPPLALPPLMAPPPAASTP